MNGPDKIMLIRHGEKPEIPPPYGVNEDGVQDAYSLSVRGWQRTGALVPYFAIPWHPAIATPQVIYASATTDNPSVELKDAKSRRPAETVTPLARKLGCPCRTDIPVGNEPELIAALQAEDGIVLVSWEHKRISTIAAGFGIDPPSWADDVFDTVWVLDRNPDGSYEFSIVHQLLLAGDA